ncbi:MAG TPA: asparagine synthase C-terminal domain-containing protein, partial [Bryobacteraceae bacterium]|nr:asparagine synthase C-terminal domain-containing protein [Bryobacteraceae bacterium]
WDSSLTAALAAKTAGTRLKTFSIVFPEDPRMDEARYARLVAKQLGTDHHEIEFRESQLPGILPKLTRHLEEPFTASPAGVVYRLASLAAGHVKTVVSGEGADELFGGYEWVRINSPYWIRRVTPRWPFRLASRVTRGRLRRALRILGAEEDREADTEWRRQLTPDVKLALLKLEYRDSGSDLDPVLLPGEVLASCSDSLQRRLAFDFTSRLTDGVLFMTDRVSMAHSLEVRMPFLDRAVVDFALRLPSSMKVRRGREKRVLAPVARRLLPKEIAARRKHGLGYPGRILRGEPSASFVRQFLLDPAGGGPFVRSYLERSLPALLETGGPRGALLSIVFLQSWWNEFVAGGGAYR